MLQFYYVAWHGHAAFAYCNVMQLGLHKIWMSLHFINCLFASGKATLLIFVIFCFTRGRLFEARLA